MKKLSIPPFFVGEITYRGEFSREVMALLELGRLIHVETRASDRTSGIYRYFAKSPGSTFARNHKSNVIA